MDDIWLATGYGYYAVVITEENHGESSTGNDYHLRKKRDSVGSRANQTATTKATIELRQLSWGEGLGWCPQQSLQLSTEEAQALLDSLRTTRHHWQEQHARRSGTVIPFPVGVPFTRPRTDHTSGVSRKKKTGETPKAPPVTSTAKIDSHGRQKLFNPSNTDFALDPFRFDQPEVHFELFDITLFGFDLTFQHSPQGNVTLGEGMGFVISLHRFFFQIKILAKHFFEIDRLMHRSDFHRRNTS